MCTWKYISGSIPVSALKPSREDRRNITFLSAFPTRMDESRKQILHRSWHAPWMPDTTCIQTIEISDTFLHTGMEKISAKQ